MRVLVNVNTGWWRAEEDTHQFGPMEDADVWKEKVGILEEYSKPFAILDVPDVPIQESKDSLLQPIVDPLNTSSLVAGKKYVLTRSEWELLRD